MRKKKYTDILTLNKEGWDNLANIYDENNPVQQTRLFKRFLALLPEHGALLDAGCGTGLPLSSFLVKYGFDVTGIDLSRAMIDLASHHVPGGTFIEMSMTEMRWESEFNGVVASYSMLLLDPLHFKDAAERISRALRPGGLFYLSLNENVDPAETMCDDAFIEIAGIPIYSRAYTEQEVTDTFGNAGMLVIEMDRRIITSTLFGEEHMMEFLMQKDPSSSSSIPL
ncbi:MAG TPA: class I SAM-dependent methyltransferase [Candidatus Lokiarchaeia archaeon]|nr:class I SAM-dependent methyltransferase [Candidatus Lokiarchaeia archaeon]